MADGAALLIRLALGIRFWSTFSGWMVQGLDAIGIQTWLADLERAALSLTRRNDA